MATLRGKMTDTGTPPSYRAQANLIPMAVTKALCRIDEIPDEGVVEIEIADETGAIRDSLVLTRRGCAVRAYRNVCPHAGRRLDWAPNRFLVEDGHVICPAHGAAFRLASGECVSGPCRGAALSAVPVAVYGDTVAMCGE